MSLLLLLRNSEASVPDPPDGCNWTAISNNAWITITSGASGTGDGEVQYEVAENAGAARSGTIFVAGFVHTVYQAGVDDPMSGAGAVVTWVREPLADLSNETYATLTYPHGYQPCVDIFAFTGRPQRDTWAFAICRNPQYRAVIENGCVSIHDPATGEEIEIGTEVDGVDVWLISDTHSVRRA